jgi:hypothetical protein
VYGGLLGEGLDCYGEVGAMEVVGVGSGGQTCGGVGGGGARVG